MQRRGWSSTPTLSERAGLASSFSRQASTILEERHDVIGKGARGSAPRDHRLRVSRATATKQRRRLDFTLHS